MSSIPNSATPEAIAEDEREGDTRTFATRAAGLFETVRDHPRTAIAAGAIAAAGVAAAIPLARRGRKADGGDTGDTGGTTATRTPTRSRRAKKKG